MISQLRIYTINRGMMDQWVNHFNEVLMPIYGSVGIKVEGAWANEDKNQFVWIRTFEDAADLEAKEAAFYGSDAWKSSVDKTRSHLARVDVQLINNVLAAAN